ncbi:unnamed protein product [Camellia sinensis]
MVVFGFSISQSSSLPHLVDRQGRRKQNLPLRRWAFSLDIYIYIYIFSNECLLSSSCHNCRSSSCRNAVKIWHPKALLLKILNVKAYLRRGTPRESLLFYKEYLQDFRHALVLEPQNKVANLAEKWLRKLTS